MKNMEFSHDITAVNLYIKKELLPHGNSSFSIILYKGYCGFP